MRRDATTTMPSPKASSKAIRAAPGVGDHAQAPGRSGQQGARGVDVAEAADFRIDQAAGGGVDAYRLLAQQPARQVQVVDGEVLEQPAAGRHESGRRRGRVVVDQVQGLEAAGFAGVEALLERTERGIETAVEAERS